MTVETKVVTRELISDLSFLFCTDKSAELCWCMWFIRPVKDFHVSGADENREALGELAASERCPIGVLAYHEGEPVGWCAVGPRERYVRAVKTPTYRTKEEDPLSNVWLVPCFYIRKDARGLGISQSLLDAAVNLAEASHAHAIDGFPFTKDKRRSSGDIQVGFESTFSDLGFETIRQPSASHVVMRRILQNPE